MYQMKKLVSTIVFTTVLAVSITSAAGAASKVLPQSMTSVMSSLSGIGIEHTVTCSSSVNATNVLGKGTAVATSDPSDVMDSVYVRVRIYNGDGSFVNSNETTKSNSAATAVTEAADTSAWVFDDYAIGTHRYELAGHNTVTHETQDNF